MIVSFEHDQTRNIIMAALGIRRDSRMLAPYVGALFSFLSWSNIMPLSGIISWQIEAALIVLNDGMSMP